MQSRTETKTLCLAILLAAIAPAASTGLPGESKTAIAEVSPHRASSEGDRDWIEVKLLTSGAGAGGSIGERVVMEEDRLIMTSDALGEPSGAVFVFDRIDGGWRETAKLTPSDVVPQGSFGGCIALSGNTIAVSAPLADDERGEVYIFERTGGAAGAWREVIQLTSPDRKDFGAPVLEGDTLLVGSAYDNDMGASAGAIYVFGRNVDGPDNWGVVAKLYASDAGSGDEFGGFKAIDGDTFIASARRDDDMGVDTGAVYVFDRDPDGDSWEEVAKLVAADAEDLDVFGGELAISGDTVVVGVGTRDSEIGNNTGVVYVFERNEGGPNQWGEVAQLTGSDVIQGDGVGDSVSISGDRIAAGGDTAQGIEEDAGAVYVFERSVNTGEWSEVAKLVASDGERVDLFGAAVAVDSHAVVVGAPADDDAGSNAGAVYVYELQPLLTATGTCPGVIDLEVLDATAGGPVVLFGAETLGSATVPIGPCAGTVLDLADPRVLSALAADESGRVSGSRTVGPNSCGRLLQALDIKTCRASTTTAVP